MLMLQSSEGGTVNVLKTSSRVPYRYFLRPMTYRLPCDFTLFALLFRYGKVSPCQKSVSLCLPLSLPPCLSLLLPAYPLTHILVITSGVPCRNSITPPSVLLPRHKTVSVSLNGRTSLSFSATLWFWLRGTGRCLSSSAAIACHLYPVAGFTWSCATGPPAPRVPARCSRRC